MFTGIVTRVGSLAALRKGTSGGHSLLISHPPWDEPLVLGESVAVMGVCLTVVEASRHDQFTVDLLDETLARTALSSKAVGARLNLERALRPMDRLGGHFVSGHVDGTGSIKSIRSAGRDKIYRVACSRTLTREMVVKGSIACDGISLTLTAVEDEAFEVHIIPHTIENTALKDLGVAALVNLETDILGKYVLKAASQGEGKGISMERLADTGFV